MLRSERNFGIPLLDEFVLFVLTEGVDTTRGIENDIPVGDEVEPLRGEV